MNIFLDCRMIKMSGIGRYIENIIKNNIYKENIIGLGDKSEIDSVEKIKDTITFDSKIYGIKEQINYPYKELKKADLLHVPHYNIPIMYRGKLITTIHDITHILFPQYLPNKFAFYYARFMISRAIKQSDYILTVSQNSKNDLIKYFNADDKKIIVTYNGIDNIFVKKDKSEYEYLYKKYNIENNKKIILYVGNKKPHKNIDTLIKAINCTKNKDDYILILTGKGFDGYTQLEELSNELNMNEQIKHTGIVTDEELVNLYNLADIFVYPSLYEGFGIPPLEAMACGTPVICSNTSSLPEVVGDSAYLINPYDERAISQAIDNLIDNRELYETLVSKGYERSKLFTWDKCRIKTEEVYKKVGDK